MEFIFYMPYVYISIFFYHNKQNLLKNVKFLFSRIHEYLLSFSSKSNVCIILLTRKRVCLQTSLNLLLPLLKFEMFRLLLPRGYLLLSLNLHLLPSIPPPPHQTLLTVSSPRQVLVADGQTDGLLTILRTDGGTTYLLRNQFLYRVF